MNVLVVGGAGYIGSATCSALFRAGHDVTVYDDLSTGHRDSLPDASRLIVASSADQEVLEQAFRDGRFDAVMDFAALIEAGESMRIPESYFRNNTANALSVVEAMLRHGVDRFVFSSSAAVYGNPRALPIPEDAALDPTNPYGESKRSFEQMLRWVHEAHGLRVGVLRYFNAAGAIHPDIGEDHRPESHLIPRVLHCALGRAAEVEIYGNDYDTPDGTCVRDFVHVDDLAAAHVLVLEALESRPFSTFNLGNGAGFSVREVIAAARAITGSDIPAVERPRRSGDPAILVASSQAIRAELGWTPSHGDLGEIVESAWRWHARHPGGYAA
jgi:UDP-glucose 4-epimerase